MVLTMQLAEFVQARLGKLLGVCRTSQTETLKERPCAALEQIKIR